MTMRRKILLVIIAVIVMLPVIGQNTNDLYKPNEYRQAYRKGTRSVKGVPGSNYFQNQTDYDIKAEFFPETGSVKGKELIKFHNNSKDNLKTLFFHLYQNVYKKGNAKDIDISPELLHDGVKIESVTVNGVKIKPDMLRMQSTLLIVPVKDEVKANSIAEIEIEWELKIPSKPHFRTGTYFDDSFFVGYWYPRICVYDDILGWDVNSGYTGYAEFYNEYGNYNVEITAPADYTVWSSTSLKNPQEIFTKEYLSRLQEAYSSDKIVQIIGKKDRKNNNITQKKPKHIWKYTATNLPDFAFALSNNYMWDAGSVKIGNKRVKVNSAYDVTSHGFKDVAEIAKKSIKFFSTKNPGITYQYPEMTVFNGAMGGMEFPGIVNDQNEESLAGTIGLTAHEIGHSYLPFYVGTNEHEYGWMDEGFVTFLTELAEAEITEDENFVPFRSIIGYYNNQSGELNREMPLMVNTQNLGDAYFYITYTKSSVFFWTLYDYLGEEVFFKAIRTFAERWKSKHPTPYDMMYTINEIAGEDLGWLWKPWLFEMGYAGVELEKVTQQNGEYTVTLKKNGKLPVSIALNVKYADGSSETIRKKADVWKNNVSTCDVKLPNKDIVEISLDKNSMLNSLNKTIWTAPHKISEDILKSYAGKYSPRIIDYDNGELYYEREGSTSGRMKMIAVSDDFFRFDEIDWFRIKIIKEKGKIIALQGQYSDGRTDKTERTN